MKKILCSCVSALALAAALPASAEETKDVAALRQLLKAQQEQLGQQEKQIAEQKERVRALAEQVEALGRRGNLGALAPAAGEAEKPKPIGGQVAVEPGMGGGAPRMVGVERKPQDRDRPPEVQAASDEASVLLRPGQAILEPSVEYSRSSAVRVAIEGFTIIPALNIGSFEISQVDRDTLIGSLTGRIGVFKNFEAELRVPYVYRSDSTLARPLGVGSSSDVLTDVSGDDLGDVELGGRYQFYSGKNGWPFLIGNLRLKSRTGTNPFEVATDPVTGLQTELPTGSGFYAVQPSVTAVLPSDPVVLYGTVGYLYNMQRDFGGRVGEIDPGDSVSASFGMGFAANERTSFSLGYSHSYVFETTQNDVTIPNSDELHVGSLLFGVGYRLNNYSSLNLNVDAGLTDDAPDMRFLVRVPFSFDLF